MSLSTVRAHHQAVVHMETLMVQSGGARATSPGENPDAGATFKQGNCSLNGREPCPWLSAEVPCRDEVCFGGGAADLLNMWRR